MIALALILCASVYVHDGDTIRCDGERIRIFGLACAELHQPNGYAARDALRKMLSGKVVYIQRTGKFSYRRTVAHVLFGPEIGPPDRVTCAMIRRGWCSRYTRYDVRGEYAGCK